MHDAEKNSFKLFLYGLKLILNLMKTIEYYQFFYSILFSECNMGTIYFITKLDNKSPWLLIFFSHFLDSGIVLILIDYHFTARKNIVLIVFL